MITKDQIEQVKDRLVKTYDPLAIYIFGSYAWGNPTEDSDLDLLVVVDQYKHDRFRDMAEGHKSLIGLMISKDILLFTKEQFEESIADDLSLCHRVFKEGDQIYAKA